MEGGGEMIITTKHTILILKALAVIIGLLIKVPRFSTVTFLDELIGEVQALESRK